MKIPVDYTSIHVDNTRDYYLTMDNLIMNFKEINGQNVSFGKT